MFLESQIRILEWFLKDQVTLKTVYNNGCWKFSFAITEVNDLKNIQIEISYCKL